MPTGSSLAPLDESELLAPVQSALLRERYLERLVPALRWLGQRVSPQASFLSLLPVA